MRYVTRPCRFFVRHALAHQRITAASILFTAFAILTLWTLLLPLSEAHDAFAIQTSLRFNDVNSANLTRTFSAGNQKTWTWSGWVKLANLGSNQHLFCSGTGTAANGYMC